MNNEDIKILEEFIEYVKKKDEIKFISPTEIHSIEHLIARNKELEEENKLYKNKQTKIIADSFHEKMAKKFDEDFIPKSKVREILEKIENRNYNDYTQKQDGNEVKYEILRDIQELLED